MKTYRLFLLLAGIILLALIYAVWNATLMSGSTGTSSSSSSYVVIDTPAPNSVVTSPLTVHGKARGTWMFEASLPVSLTDSDGNIIVQSYGQAESDWMTTEFVPFSSTLVFQTTATDGFLVIAKDNPSGLPEHDANVKIPVKF